MRSSQSRALFSFTFVSAGPGDAVSFNVPVYASASAVVQEKRLTLDGSSGVSVWAAPVAVTAIARTVSGQLVAVEATVDRPTVAEVPSGGGGSGLPVPGSGDAGKVVTVTGGEDGFELDAPAGGASELLQHIVFPFAFDTVGLTDGVVVHTPTADVFVVGAWIAPTPTAETPWDGTTPLGDVGDVTQTYGMWGFVNGQLPALDSTGNEFGGLQQIPPKWDLVSAAVFAGGSYSPIFRFAAGTDIGVWVTQNGYRQGADPGSTQGAATVHLLLVPAT